MTTSVKIACDGESRRLPSAALPTHDFGSFFSAARALFPSSHGEATLLHEDRVGDRVTVRSTCELEEAFKDAQGQPTISFTLSCTARANRRRSASPLCPSPALGIFGRAREPSMGNATSHKNRSGRQTRGRSPGHRRNATRHTNNAPGDASPSSFRHEHGADRGDRTPSHSRKAAQAHYRRACALSLQGENEASLHSLRQSIDEGFARLKHVATDKDLLGVSLTDEFGALLLGMAKAKFERSRQHKHQYPKQAGPGGFLAGKLQNFRKKGDPRHLASFARACLRDEEVQSTATPLLLFHIACVFARSGDTEEALSALALAVERGIKCVKRLQTEADLEPIRPDSRFADLVAGLLKARQQRAARKPSSSSSSEESDDQPMEVDMNPQPTAPAATFEDVTKPQATAPTAHTFAMELQTIRAMGIEAPEGEVLRAIEDRDGDLNSVVEMLLSR